MINGTFISDEQNITSTSNDTSNRILNLSDYDNFDLEIPFNELSGDENEEKKSIKS
jgi:hypothetical protein